MATFVCGNVSWGRQNLDTYQYTYMCVYHGSINKTIYVKNSLNHTRYLSNAGNIVQSSSCFFFSSSGIHYFCSLSTWVHKIMRTSTLRVKDEALFEPVLSVQPLMNKPVTGKARCTHGCVFMLGSQWVNVQLRLPAEEYVLKLHDRQNGWSSPLRGLHLDYDHIHTAECIYLDVFK